MTRPIRLSGLAQSTSSSLTVDLTASGVRTFSGSPASTLTFTLGSRSHGVDYTLFIPAGKFTTTNGLAFSGNWNVFPPYSGYSFDQTKDTIVQLKVLVSGSSTLVWGNAWQVAAPDVTAPTVESASATASALTVVYSEAVITTATGGLSLNFTTGTARTITGITSGSGTDTIVYSLSGAVTGTDVATFVVAGSGVQVADAAGNAVAAGSTSITFSGGATMPQTGSLLSWVNAPRQVADGTSIATRVTNYAPSASHMTATNVTLNAGGWFDYAADSVITGAMAAPSGAGGYTALVIARTSSFPDYAAMWSSSGGDQFSNFVNPSDAFEVFHNGANGNGGTATSYADGNWHAFVFVFSGGTVNVYVDSQATPVATFTAGSPSGSNLQLGRYAAAGFTTWPGDIKAGAIWNSIALTQAEREAAIIAVEALS